MKKGLVIWLLFVVVAGFSFGFTLIALWFNKVEWASFAITVLAFGAAIYAIYNQHKESKKAEENFKEQFSLQKDAALKQEIIGAWQVLANKASGNSGKKEAIEFLASQNKELCGIDMSKKTHGGEVYLAYLFKGFEGDISKIDLTHAKFSGANLYLADFSETYLFGADFSGVNLGRINFSGANLGIVDFSKIEMFDDKAFIDCYCRFSNIFLPKPPPGYKFEIENRTDENNQPIYPKNNPDYRYIKLIKLKEPKL